MQVKFEREATVVTHTYAPGEVAEVPDPIAKRLLEAKPPVVAPYVAPIERAVAPVQKAVK